MEKPEGEHPIPRFMNVHQVAGYLGINDKKVYALVSEGAIPATKITGKWLFPRELIDQWILESSHGGVLTDRLVLSGSDDPLLYRAVMLLAEEIQDHALVSYTCTGTRLGLSLLARHRADGCALHWGPVEESQLRHPALLRQHPQHHDWVLIRIFRRQQGLILSRRLHDRHRDLAALLGPELRWALRQDGAGSQRFLADILGRFDRRVESLNAVARGHSEREVASLVARGLADVAPGVRGAATEFGLDHLATGWEAFDLALYRGIYFRTLFQKFLEHLQAPECRMLADALGGYDFAEFGQVVWSG